MRNSFKSKKALKTVALLMCLIMALGTASMAAQSVKAVDVSGRGSGYTSVLYNIKNGLPTSEANAIVQSEDGFIWIGGYSGLIRYDGNEFYRFPATTGISSVVCLFMDSLSRLWIGTNDNGAALFENGEFKFYGRKDGLRSSSVRSIAEDNDGNIIIATTMGICRVDTSGKLVLIDDPLVNKEYVCELTADRNGTVYGLTLSGDVLTVEGGQVTGYYKGDRIGADMINTVFPDSEKDGYVYLGTINSEVLYGNLKDGFKNPTVYSTAPQSCINAIRIFDGRIWICADDGIGFFNNNRDYIEVRDVPMSNSIDKMIEDYEGNLWFCSSRQGVMKIVENKFNDIFKLAGFDNAVVNTTCKAGDDLYIGTDEGLLVLDKDYHAKENNATKLLTESRIRCIKQDASGKLWLCTYSDNGLVCFDPAQDSCVCYNEQNGLASSRARMITFLKDGSVAVATNRGVNLIKDGVITATYGNDEEINNLEILCIEEGKDGKLYVGSDGNGIYIIDGHKISNLGLADGLSSEVILRITQDPKEDILWLVTSNSIGYMKDGKITTVTNFPYSNNFEIKFDSQDRMWILSSNGIYNVRREAMISNENITYNLYDTSSGLPGVATANSYSCLDNGVLYIASSTGVSSINIEGETEKYGDIKLAVPYVMVDGNYMEVEGDRISLPADCKRLNIYANAFTYSLANPHIKYRLEGFDDEWTETTKQELGDLSYTNLAGGTYTFELSVVNTFTRETEKTVKLTIEKQKALYEQLWFNALLLLLIGLGILIILGMYFKKKTAALVKKQEEDRKLINEMASVFAKCIDMKDAYTNGHSVRVAKYTSMLARQLGYSDEEIEHIHNIALLHDIGKISIPDDILNKPGRLDDEEFKVMKGHSKNGYDILKEVSIAPDLALGAGYHHEKIDGSGYPSGLKGDEIPFVAQIIAVADTFDAMYSTRPYRKKLKLEDVAAEIKRVSGTQLSPEVVKAFTELYESGAFNESDGDNGQSEQNNEDDK